MKLLLRLAFLTLLLPGGALHAANRIDYQRQVKLVLSERCYACHGALQQKGGLRLDTVALMKQGGERGPAIVPGKANESILLDHLQGKPGARRMPPAGEGDLLKPTEIEVIRLWIQQGAPAPADEKPEPDPRDHWAFKIPVRPAQPRPRDAAWVRNPIDAFVRIEQEKRGLRPQPEVDRRVLLRRVYLDLIGLPPTREEQQAFLADTSPRAYERVVERLLASRQYSERWGRHWMDIWRYSDWWGLGAEVRNSQKHIWHWRDWILDSLNADKGYDQMVREMLAADELYPTDADRLRATGYLARQYFKFNRNTWLEEVVEHTSKAFLGLTMNCVKCHDHKYDPFVQEDFYRLRAFFEPYQVRTDMVAGVSDYEANGVPRAFDCNLDAPTHVFVRGDERQPRKSRLIRPGLPALLAPGGVTIQTVALPAEAHQPGLRRHVVETLLQEAAARTRKAEADLAAAQKALADVELASKAAVSQPEPILRPFVQDDFAKPAPERWEMREGTWRYEKGKLNQSKVGAVRGALRLKPAAPRDFQATVRFTPTGGEMWKSVGINFDAGPQGEVLVYLSAVANSSKLQVAYKQPGSEYIYPPEGTLPRDVKLGTPQEVKIQVRGRLLNVSLQGKFVLAYQLPIERRSGAIELITYDASAEFARFELSPLPDGVSLHLPGKAGSSVTALTVPQAKARVAFAEKQLARLRLEPASIEARAAADRARYQPPAGASAKEQIRKAARAERLVAVAAAEEALAQAQVDVVLGTKGASARVEEATKQLTQARLKVDAPGEEYTPLRGSLKTLESNLESEASRSKPYPTTSSGRRSALVRWLTAPENPLTARVAVNHVWARHFGKPLVATVFDFGRKGAVPTHPELLDWLAVEFRENGWSLKHLHRLMVTSATYRQSSSSRDAGENATRDGENRYLWRMNPLRMEAEVVRDSLLHLAGDLDLTTGGPPVMPTVASRRRSLYFVHSHNDHQKFLSLFDHANVLECYRRAESIIPQQALALANSALAQETADRLTARLDQPAKPLAEDAFIQAAFEAILGQPPSGAELAACRDSLAEWRKVLGSTPAGQARSRRALVLSLINHNDFVTIR
ncbi:MAG: PSD1 and planctomycete cytochrome C domain-containing protein [Gemmataceae bacterium]